MEIEKKSRERSQSVLRKINRSIDLKQKNLKKIQDKCHMRLQYEEEKRKEQKKKIKLDMFKSWKESQKLGEAVIRKRNSDTKSIYKHIT